MPIFVVALAAAVPAAMYAVRAQRSVAQPQPSATAVPKAVRAPAPVPQVAPAQLMAEARTTLGRRRSIGAKIRHHAELYGRDVRGNGLYLQGPASSRLMRYELTMQAGNRVVDFLEVNDGRYLWRRKKTESVPNVERVDVDALFAAVEGANAQRALDPALLLGLGGLGKLLAALDRDFDFSQALPPRELDGLPVYGIAGRLRPEALERFKATDGASLRPHVPDHVVVYFGRDDYFPYLIEFRRTDAGAGEGAPSWRRLVTLEFFEVEFDVPIDGTLFHFNWEHLHPVDATARAIAEIKATR